MSILPAEKSRRAARITSQYSPKTHYRRSRILLHRMEMPTWSNGWMPTVSPCTFNDRWITASRDAFPLGADPEERNSFGLSAFHVALQHGRVQILKYFFESYDPRHEDHNAIYSLSPPKSLLSIALDSAEPEVVWMILDRGLATTQDIGNVWTEVMSLEGKQALLKKMGNDNMKYTEIQNLLMSYGGFTPPPTPKVPTQKSSPLKNQTQGSPVSRGGFHPRGRGTHRSKTTPRTAQAHSLDETPVPTQNGTADPTCRPPENGGRGKARGRGRGRGRGYSRGRGRGRAN